MSDQTLIERLAEFVAVDYHDQPPDAVRHSAADRVLDTVGVCLAALPLDTSQAITTYVATLGGVRQATALGVAEPVPAAQAAFVNGVLAHSLDYDDTHLPSILHPSASVVPAALAAGELAGSTGPDVLAATAVGIEVCVRLGMAGYDRKSKNSLFFERGQHATSICGAVASAAAAARLLGLQRDGIADAMGVAVSMASGVIEANRTGGTVKRLHCGWAAHAGVTAAELAQRGFTGPPTVLEGRFGFYEAFVSGEFDRDALIDGLGERWAVPDIFFKPYPANHFTHAGIDAALALRAGGLRPDEVAAAHLAVASPAVRTIGEPLDHKQRPASGHEARFSGPFTVAAALLGGGGLGVGLDDFTDVRVRDRAVLQLTSKITVGADPSCDEVFPYQFPAVLTVHTNDGRTLVERVMSNRGGPQRPLSKLELRRKFDDNAAIVLQPGAAPALRHAIESLEDRADVRGLLAPAAALR